MVGVEAAIPVLFLYYWNLVLFNVRQSHLSLLGQEFSQKFEVGGE